MRRALPFLIVGPVVLLVVLAQLAAPRQYDPRLLAERDGIEPFDAQVVYRLLPDWLDAPVETVDRPPFERLADTSLVGTTYVFMTGAFEPDGTEAERLLDYVARGNTVVVAAHALGGPFFEAIGDTTESDEVVKGGGDEEGGFGLETQWGTDLLPDNLGALSEPDTLSIDSPRLGRPEGFGFPVSLGAATLSGIDTTRSVVIGRHGEFPVAVAVTVGQGRAIVLSTPVALTNAALAGDGDAGEYLAGVFAYVPPTQPVLWDDYYKPLRTTDRSLLRYAVRSPALNGALWAIGLGTLLAVVFWGRRRQRPVPVVAPPPNAQRDFARTVGRLFFVRNDSGWLSRRQRLLFEDALRTRLGISDADLSDATALRAALRAGVTEDEALALFRRLRELSTDPSPSAAALLASSRDIDAFLAARDRAARDVSVPGIVREPAALASPPVPATE